MAEDAAPRGKMSDEELLALIARMEKASLGSEVAAGATISSTVYPSNSVMPTLEIDRFNALNAYYARPLGNEVENRSQIVLPELRDTVEWIVPQLMRMFAGAKTVCRFEPENQNDEDQAELETMVVNHLFMQENNGVILLQDFFKDALLLRNGYGEVFTEEETQVTEERYTGLDEMGLSQLLQDNGDEKIEVIEQTETVADVLTPQGVQKVPQWDLKIKRRKKVKTTKVVCLPPEEMRISPQTRGDMEDCPFAMHVTVKTRSDLKADGYKASWVDGLTPAPAGQPNWLEMDALARNQVVDQLSVENPSDRAMQQIELRRVVMRVDYDGDGIAELRRIVVGGDSIGENEMIEETPFVSCTPKRMPHRHTGISLYDEIMDLQVLKTVLFRQGMDNLAIANNSRVAVDWQKCNFDDLLTSRPGGAVRGEGPPSNWIMPLEQPSNLVQQILPALAYLDEMKTMRTGIGKQMMSPDPDDLQNVTKGAQMAAVSAAALKVEMIARLLAEGVKRMFQKIHSEFVRNQDKPLWFAISGKWVEVDPTKWRPRKKISVNVGLGSANQEEMRANLMQIAQAQSQLAQMGLVGPPQAYASFKMLCEALGFQNPERFAMDPSSQEYQQMMANRPPPPQAPQVQVAQIRAQTEQAKQQSTDQREIMKLQAQVLQDKLSMVHEHLQNQQELSHDAVQQHKGREVQLDQNHLQILLKLIPAIAQVLAAEKGNPQELGSDVESAAGAIQ